MAAVVDAGGQPDAAHAAVVFDPCYPGAARIRRGGRLYRLACSCRRFGDCECGACVKRSYLFFRQMRFFALGG